MKYTINVDSDEPVMLLNKHIGYDEEDGQGIDGALFQQELLALDQMGKKRIQVWINSVGGSVMDGYNICNAILKSNTRVDTYCLGMAASIAGVIFQTGRKRIMADYGILMYHNPYAGETTESPLLDQMKSSLNKIVAEKSGMTCDAVQRMMDRTSFIDSTEAKNMGLCDEIEQTVKLNTKNFPKEVKAFAAEAGKVLNKIINSKTMLKVTNKLKLNADANEDSIVSAIEEVVNKAVADATAVANKKSKEDLDKMKADMDEAEDKFKKQKEAFDKATAELAEANNKIKAAADKALDIEAKTFAENVTKEGKVKNEAKAIAAVVAQYKANPAGTKEIFEAIPTNKTGVKFEFKNEAKQEDTWSTAGELAKISNKLSK